MPPPPAQCSRTVAMAKYGRRVPRPLPPRRNNTVVIAASIRKRRLHQPRHVKKLFSADPKKLLQLYRSIKEENVAFVMLRIVHYLEEYTGAEKAFLLLLSEESDELTCKVIGSKVLPEEVKFPITHNSFSLALTSKRTLTIEDIKQEHVGVLKDISKCSIKSLHCVPIGHPQNTDKIIMLACLINKNNFTPDDEAIVEDCCNYTLPLLLLTISCECERRQRLHCQSLLAVAKNLFTHLDDVTQLLKNIMCEAKNLTKAERCSLFLLEKERNELVAKVFDDGDRSSKSPEEIRFPATEGIAGFVATTGKLLNIIDAYSHPLFYSKMDLETGFKTRNILCFPIKDANGVVGVAELCNKINGKHFTSFDEEMAQAFSIYCGISIMHSLMWKKVRDAQDRSKVCNELMMYHMQVSQEEYVKLASEPIPPMSYFHSDFDKFHFTPRSIPENMTPLAVMFMFEDLGFLERFQLSKSTLAKFILMVKKGYRDPPYHNWYHAFSVAHFTYLLLKNLRIVGNYLSPLESFSLLVSCLCHDLDHRGTTNSFQVTTRSILATLYSSEGSVMERHHLAQAIAILNTDGCNIFENLTEQEYSVCLDCLRDAILATDLAHHLRIINKLNEMAAVGYDYNNPEHHYLLICMFISCSDLSDQTKDWRLSKKVAELVYSEFFSQGDLEKAMGVKPSEMMDREKACIPDQQINFLQNIVLPLYNILVKLFPEAARTATAITENMHFWEKMGDICKHRYANSSSSSLDIFENSALEEEVFYELEKGKI